MPERNLLLHDFLSCLYGSEPLLDDGEVVVQFLSCLYGSELRAARRAVQRCFLSCLYGSELEQSTPITLSDKEIT